MQQAAWCDGASTAYGINLPSGTPGAWTVMFASTPFDADGMFLMYMGNGDTNSGGNRGYIELGFGAAASEGIILNRTLTYAFNKGHVWSDPACGSRMWVPIRIPVGTRVVARAKNTGTFSPNSILSLSLVQWDATRSPFLSCTRAQSYGVSTAVDAPIVDPGAVVNSKGGWTELAASLDFDTKYVGLAIGQNGSAQVGASTQAWRLDIGAGGAGAEYPVISDITAVWGGAWTDHHWIMPMWVVFPLSLPAGARVSARAQADFTDATNRTVYCALITMG